MERFSDTEQVLWVQVAVTAATSFLVALAASVTGFRIGRIFLTNAGPQLALFADPSGTPAGLRAVFLAAPLYLCGVVLAAIALGFLMRNSAAAIATF